MLFVEKYWKVIVVLLLLVLTNLFTYTRTTTYVNTQWELKWSEANVDALKSTIEQQKIELDKQKELIKSQGEQNEKDQKRNEELTDAVNSANKSVSLLKQKLQDLSDARRTSSNSTSDVRSAAAEATNKLVLSELLSHCAERYRRMAETADRARNAGLSCQEQYNSVKAIINKEK